MPTCFEKAKYQSQLKEYIENNLARFVEYDNTNVLYQNPAGYKKTMAGHSLFLFKRVSFLEACGNISATDDVCKYLLSHNLLHRNNGPRNEARFAMPGSAHRRPAQARMSFYAIRESILECEFAQEE